MLLREAEALLRHRHRANALACCRENRIANGGQNRRQSRFAQARRRVIGFQKMDFDLRRRLRHSQHRVLMIVRLHDGPVFQRDFLHHFAQAIYDRALHLSFGGTGIDDVAANVSRDPDFIHFDFLVGVDGDFGDFGKVTAMAEMERDAHAPCLSATLRLPQPDFSATSLITPIMRDASNPASRAR